MREPGRYDLSPEVRFRAPERDFRYEKRRKLLTT